MERVMSAAWLRGDGDDDGSGAGTVSHVVLDDENRTAPSLLRAGGPNQL
jgi:hypothetical protein